MHAERGGPRDQSRGRLHATLLPPWPRPRDSPAPLGGGPRLGGGVAGRARRVRLGGGAGAGETLVRLQGLPRRARGSRPVTRFRGPGRACRVQCGPGRAVRLLRIGRCGGAGAWCVRAVIRDGQETHDWDAIPFPRSRGGGRRCAKYRCVTGATAMPCTLSRTLQVKE